ncbi:MAG: glycine--tRNA ligase subunit beta [Peptoniphilaceae bacterium]|nr:glycine--tRNA ligase subunit beta [Peptoniphilaceae bacterium]MDD7383522.1 glycine--tRNA ligase subunit beta [Peptoniphilaceae bacterium]MDY3738695.1 glycine--tRNA ligase subunit beta [Peptoniphilaceae bacterium]
MSKYLLEIGVEEFPSAYVKSTKLQLEEKFEKLLDDKNISFDEVRVESTPRRFSILILNMEKSLEKKNIKIKGPSKKIAYSQNGEPTQALLGFLKSQDASISSITIEKVKDEDYVFVNKEIKSTTIKEDLKDNVFDIVKSLSFPRSMHWGGKDLKFARPIRWFVSLLDDEILPFEAEGIRVSNVTKGHRVLGSDEIVVDKIDNYNELLRENYVILKYKDRYDMIVRGINKLAKEKGGSVLQDEDLLDEVINIVEYPTALIGKFDEKYLSLPKEVIITPMKNHQRYFPVINDEGQLLPYFITVRNGDETDIENVSMGNERVLTARLEDAKFFFEQDTSKPLSSYVDNLSNLTFYDGLKDMLSKTLRMQDLSVEYLKRFQMSLDLEESVKRACYLSKADLITNMVIEFTELEGTIGKIYAKLSGEDEIVANAIEEQYLPKSQDSETPKSSVGIVVSITEKMDNICGLYAIEKYVTGTKDPYGLRRQALGIINILIENKIDVDLRDLIKDSLYIYTNRDALSFNYDLTEKKVLDFILERLKNKLLDDGYKYDHINSVMSITDSNIYDIYLKLNQLEEFSNLSNFEEKLNYFTRVSNIVKDFNSLDIDEKLVNVEEEKMVFDFIKKLSNVDSLINTKQYKDALNLLSEGKNLVNEYLDKTMIMVDDEKLKNNRLSILNNINFRVKQIFIPEKIVK